MTRIESLGRRADVWDFEAGYLPELPSEKEIDPNLQNPNDTTEAPATSLFTAPIWPHSY